MASAGRHVILSYAAVLEAVLSVLVVLGAVTIQAVGEDEPFYTTMAAAEPVPAAPPAVAGASTGSYSWDCGRNDGGHRNTANIVVTPGRPGPPHHEHDYVGNLGVRSDSTVDSIVGSSTTCGNGDASTYFWPVLRYGKPDAKGHGGPAQVPVEVNLTYFGNPRGSVLPMPFLLRAQVGDAYARTNGGKFARARWTCSDTLDRQTTKYPLCSGGANVTRIFDFPSCWDGVRLDSPDHRGQVVFAAEGGGCPVGTFAVPRLRITMTYAVAAGARYRVDAFPEQGNDPTTDHGFLVNLMPEPLMTRVVTCLNRGLACDDSATKRSSP